MRPWRSSETTPRKISNTRLMPENSLARLRACSWSDSISTPTAPLMYCDVTHKTPTQNYEMSPYIKGRSEEHTSELQTRGHIVCRLLLEKKKYTGRAKHRSIIRYSFGHTFELIFGI